MSLVKLKFNAPRLKLSQLTDDFMRSLLKWPFPKVAHPSQLLLDDLRGNRVARLPRRRPRAFRRYHFYLSKSVFKIILQKSIPPQIRQLNLDDYVYKEQVDGFVRELTFAKRLEKHFL